MGGLSQRLASVLLFVLPLCLTVEAVTQSNTTEQLLIPQETPTVTASTQPTTDPTDVSTTQFASGAGETTTTQLMPEPTTVTSLPPGFSVQPQSVITFLNSGLAEFHCTSDPQFIVRSFFWQLNGESITNQVQQDRGIVIDSEIAGESGNNSTLRIVTALNNNGVEITCMFESQQIVNYTSDPARLDLRFVVIGFEQSSYTVAEGSQTGRLSVCANISQDNLIDNVAINARVFSMDGTTINALDYVALPMEGFILGLGLPGAVRNCLELTIVDDLQNEGPEMLTLKMNTTQPYVVVSTPMTNIIILDDDVVQISFEMIAYSVSERDRMAEICAIVNQSEVILTRALSVNVTYTPITADDFGDFMFPRPVVFIFDPEVMRECVMFAVNNDSFVEGNETFTVQLSSNDPLVNLDPSMTVVTIIDENLLTIGFQQLNYTLLETSETPVQVCVMISEGTLDITVQVNVTTSSNSTAMASLDYSPPISTELTFDQEVLMNCLVISIIDDGEVEENETIILSLSTDNPQITLDPSETLIIVVSEDEPIEVVVLGFQRADYIVDEDAGSFQACITVEHNNSTMVAELTVQSDDRTEMTPLEYQLIESDGAIMINPETIIYCVDLIIFDDTIVDGNKTFSLILNTTNDFVRFTNQTTSITIIDNDVAVIGLTNGTEVMVREGEQSVQLTIAVLSGALGINVMVQLLTQEMTATGGQDFDNNPQLLTFNSTVTTVQATILIIPDTQIEPASESFTVMLQLVPPSDQLNVILNPNMTRIMILDDDQPIPTFSIGFEQTSYTFAENVVGLQQVCALVSITNGSTVIGNETASLRFTVVTDTASDGDDFNFQSVMLQVTTSSTRVCRTIDIIIDTENEPPKTLRIYLNTDDPELVLFTERVSNVTIVDSIGFSAAPQSVDTFINFGPVQFNCTSDPDIFINTLYWTVDGERLNPEIEGSRGLTVVTTGGAENEFSSTLTVDTIVGNEMIEIECVLIPVSSLNMLFAVADMTLRAITVGFQMESYTLTENVGLFSPCVTILNTNLPPGTSVNLTLTGISNTSREFEDFEINSSSIVATDPSPGSLICFNITIFDDEIIEGFESFSLIVSSTNSYVLFNTSMAIITIMDNDVLTIGFESSSYAISEASGNFQACVQVQPSAGGLASPITVFVTAINDTATAPQDFELSEPTSFTVNNSLTRFCVNIVIINNNQLMEPSRTGKIFNLTLSTLDSGVMFVNRTTMVSIHDDEVNPPVFTVSGPNSSVVSGETVSFQCSVVFLGGLRTLITFQWFNTSGSLVTTSSAGYVIREAEMTENGATSQLNITSVLTSQAGLYTCRANVDTIARGIIVEQSQVSISVQISSPSVFISRQSRDPTFNIGEILSLTCTIGADASTDIDIIPTIEWTVSYFENDLPVANSFIATNLTAITPAVFSTPLLVFNPLLRSMSVSCRSFLLPGIDNDLIMASGYGITTLQVTSQTPPVTVVTDPSTIVIADVAPYNTYTITCNVSLPSDVTGLRVNITWQDARSGEILTPNGTITIETTTAIQIKSSRLYMSVLTITENVRGPTMLIRKCVAEVSHVMVDDNGLEVGSFPIAVESNTTQVRVNGFIAPNAINDFYAYGVSHELAIIEWCATSITYTPETYYVTYQERSEVSTPGPVLISAPVNGTTNLSATNVVYRTTIEGLNANTLYSFSIVANNSNGVRVMSTLSTREMTFTTRRNGVYNTLSAVELPLGAPIFILFDVFDLFLPLVSTYNFYPLNHVISSSAPIPNFTPAGEGTVVSVSFSNASPSLTGTYVLCFDAVPPSRRRRTAEPVFERNTFECGGKVNVTVLIPTLTISTEVLVYEYDGNRLVGNTAPQVSCTPSIPNAPVRWRTFLGVYGMLPSDYETGLSPSGLNQTLSFPTEYDATTPPKRTEVFICDLVNVELPDEEEVTPQNVTVRFIQSPISILNNDKELPPNAVINVFSRAHPLGNPLLSLRCYSTENHSDLFWEAANVPNLADGYISPETVASTSSLSILTIGTPVQDTVLTQNPISNLTFGTYTCRSRASNSFVEILTTDIDPFWMSRTSMFIEAPIGYVVKLSVLYADVSVGYMNFGTGFSYVLKFIPCVEILPDRVLLMGTTGSFGNELSYMFRAELGVQDGTYQINATHKSSGRNYSNEIEVRVIEPYVADYDSIVYGLLGGNVTLRCIPNDTRAPVLWRVAVPNGEIAFLNLEDIPNNIFSLSPPDVNHTVTFNTSLFVLPSRPPDEGPRARRQSTSPLLPRGPATFVCGFKNGDSTLAYNPTTVDVFIQNVNIQVQYLDGTIIVNNTVINQVVSTTTLLPFDKRSVGSPSEPQSSGLSPDDIIIECITTQRNHLPLWRTDSDFLSDENGTVTCDDGANRQVVTSNYTTELQFEGLSPFIRGTYICQSQLIGPSYSFTITPENPYLRRVSPRTISAIAGDTVTLEFVIAANSNGNIWSNPQATFFFTNEEGETSLISFPTPSGEFPHNYIRVMSPVTLSDAGTYTARVPILDCGFEGEDECGDLDESITLAVTVFCPQEVGKGFLWPRTIEGSSVTLQCSNASPRFRRGVSTTRFCLDQGIWESIDISPCTLVDNADPFLLLWLTLDFDELPSGTTVEENGVVLLDESTRASLEMEVVNLLNANSVSHSEVRIQSAYIASIVIVFDVTLTLPPSEQTTALLDFLDFFTSVLTSFGGYDVREGNRGSTGIAAASTCSCTADTDQVIEGSTTSATFVELCSGTSQSPCVCNNSICECVLPFVGDGRRCTLDTDGDLYPDVALDSPTCTNADEGDIDRFCVPDNCPLVINADQNQEACRPMDGFNGCPFGQDVQWDIMWPNTPRNTTSTQRCPGGLEIMGNATRYCDADGNWTVPVVIECRSPAFVNIQTLADALFSDEIAPEVLLAESSSLTMQIVLATTPKQESLLPNDLLTSTTYINSIIDVLEENINSTEVEPDPNLVDVFNNVLWVENTAGWLGLQAANTSVGSEALLDSSERFGFLLAQRQNNASAEPMRLSRERIVISANQYVMDEDDEFSGLKFPKPEDLVNYTRDYVAAEIQVPPAYIVERMDQLGKKEGDTVPIVYILYNNIEGYLPSSLNDSNTTQSRSVVISAQVGKRKAEKPSNVLQNAPVFLRFMFDEVTDSVPNYACVTWNFSDPIGNGSWVTDGVRKRDNETENGFTKVECSSTHLTSFAVLVDVGGGLQNISDAERRALQIVSYVGCGISVACLLITVIFFILQGKKLFNAVHFFVHLNLALSLLLAFTVFIFFLETVKGVPGLCAFVAALLHYLFLSAFCWMLCEGIMLYLLLVVVFSKAAKRWWMFLLIGYLTPLPFVLITVAVRYQYYGVRDENGELLYCWLSVDRGTIFGFVAPMLLIILINVVFLILALHSLWKTRRNRLINRSTKRDEKTRMKTTKTLFMASVVLLPLLGLTWAFGILTVNSNTTVFAWIFTVLNSLQGVGILFFHVIRNDRVWSKIGPRLTTFKRSTLRTKTYSVSQSDTSTLKSGTYKSKSSTSSRYELGTLSRESTLGRGGVGTMKEKKDFSSTLHSISEYTSEHDEETKLDLAALEEAQVVKSRPKPEDEKKTPLCDGDKITEGGIPKPLAAEHGYDSGKDEDKPIANVDDNVIANTDARSETGGTTQQECNDKRTDSEVKLNEEPDQSEVIANPGADAPSETDEHTTRNVGSDAVAEKDKDEQKAGSKTVEGDDGSIPNVEVSHL